MEPVTIRLAVTNATVAVDTMENNAKMVWFCYIGSHNFYRAPGFEGNHCDQGSEPLITIKICSELSMK